MNLPSHFNELTARWLPRILTQLDRDPTSASYGCADRNWWHYKIRDFPSIILQQAGYTAYVASTLPTFASHQSELHALAGSACRFWSLHIGRLRTFDEYYPWEQGYPPLAFSSLAVAKMAGQGVVPADDIEAGAGRAIHHLTRRFESQAANQQMAGLAALCWFSKLFPGRIPTRTINDLTDRTLALQYEEGWFEEYGGPDLGYLSVTLDCLWDAYDATANPRFIDAAASALHFIDTLTALTGRNIGMHNARNTDYLVPYGLVRFMFGEQENLRQQAARLVHRLYGDLAEPDHFLHATDDRYLCHYIGPSVFRATALLGANTVNEPASAAPTETAYSPRRLEQSGYVLYPNGIVSLHKGGILSVRSPDGAWATDFGWMVAYKGKRYVSHWWSREWTCEAIDGGWLVQGALVPCKEIASSPLKHIVLRVASRLFGPALIRHLKKALIFRAHASPYHFSRRIYWVSPSRVQIEDRVSGLPPEIEPLPAPRASRRHVASADSFHSEDFIPVHASWTCSRTQERRGAEWHTQTIYSLEE